MDWVRFPQIAAEFLKKYRYVALVLLAGIFLMALPQQKEEPQTYAEVQEQETLPDLSVSLENILSQLQGAGKVRVLLTYAAGPETVYQQIEDIPSGEGTAHREPAVLSDGQRGQTGMVRKELSPQYQGAVVLCQGADSAAVRLAIVEAVSNATGLPTNCISVLKMK